MRPLNFRPLSVLCFHGISLDDEHIWNPELFIAPELFRRRMQLLRDLDCAVLPLSIGLERLYSGTLPRRAVSVTFDDGLRDFLRQALPILEEFQIPATLFATTSRCQSPDAHIPHLLESYREWKHSEPHDPDVLRMMSLEQLREANERGVRIELHGHKHNMEGDVRWNIQQNRAWLQRATGQRDFRMFAYPGGIERPDLIRDSEIVFAFSTKAHRVRPWSDPLLLPRFCDNSTVPDARFRCFCI